MPVKSSVAHTKEGMYEAHDCCFNKDCSRAYMRHLKNMDFGRKLLATLLGIFLVYSTVLVGTLIRNNLRSFYFIGKADAPEHTISVESQGKVTVVPDIAMTTMGMISDAATVAEAQQKNTETMNKLIDRLKGLAIEAKDIQTANYNVYPQYEYSDKGVQTLKGYQVSQNVTVKIRNLQNSQKVLALAGELGINNVSGITFTIDDREVYKAQAREIAIQKVQAKAAALSSSLGVHIVGIVNYNEYEGGQNDYPLYKANVMADSVGAAAPAPSIEPGSTDVLLNVSVTYQIQ
jgi:uncharacterized protein YggE